LVVSFDVDDPPTGSYFLHLVFLDENNEALAEQTKRFYVYNPDVERPAAAVGADEGYEASLYAIMSEEEVEANLRHAAVIATQQELAQMRQPAAPGPKRAWRAALSRRRATARDPPDA